MTLPIRLCARVAAIAVALAAGAGSRPGPSIAAETAAVPLTSATLATAYDGFGFNVVRELRGEKPGTNVFVSPTSIALALAMVAHGAEGPTQEAILSTLGLNGTRLDALDAANHDLIAALNGSQDVQLAVANALWLQNGFPVIPAYRDSLQSFYGAQAENVDFRDASTASKINDWAAKHTNDRITKLVENIDPTTTLMLTNAVAFKAKWTSPFDATSTKPHDFTLAGGAVHPVAMMVHESHYSYAKTAGIETIRLPYADGNFAMYVVLPSTSVAMARFVDGLNPDAFTDRLSSLSSRQGTIELPRFTIAYDATLNPVLEKLGMGIAFGNAANFDGIHQAPPPIKISLVRHASFLKVDEMGTEAAAATSVGMRSFAMRMTEPPFHMIVDRPFFVAIRDEQTGQLLFTGTIADPGT